MFIYDCEIKNLIPDRNPRLPGYSYCQGWEDFEGMGIAVVAAYEYGEDRYRVFCGDNLSGFVELLKTHKECVGFNNRRFDDRLLKAHGIEIPPIRSIDLLRSVWAAAGLDPDNFRPQTHGGFNLGMMAKANFGYGKATGAGAQAPILWQDGKIGSVIDYCIEDVRMTKALVDKVMRDGTLIHPRNGKILTVNLRHTTPSLFDTLAFEA